MKKFKDLVEAKDTIVFTFGRYNPPTTGHEKVIQKVVSVAGSNPYRIYPSFTQNPKKDPLPHALKVAYMRKMFKRYARNIVADKDARTAIHIAVKLYDEGFKNLVMVAGSDRIKEFDTLLNTYNGVEGKRHGYYKFDSINIVNAGQRDPDSEGVEGMSASKMRVAASNGDMDSFLQGVPSGFSDGKKLYRDVRKHMGIREERKMGDMTDFETLRDAYLTGQIWNVGDVVEVNGLTGEVVRKGTNYLSFMTEDGKVHKAWLHEVASYGYVDESMRMGYGSIPPTHDNPLITVHDAKGGMLMHDKLSAVHGRWKFVEYTKNKKSLIDKIHKAGVGHQKIKVTTGKKGPGHPPKGYSPAGSKLTIGLSQWHEKEVKENLDERNYRKEYDNYQGRPEQIVRRSSRNKARRVMGDKTKIGMDVGHRDNDPLNNDPSNLRNEDPSKNRREPRLRGKELDEVWWEKAIAKLDQITHPKGYGKMIRDYAELMRQDKYKKHPNQAADEVAREYRGINTREFRKYINKLVAKNVLPKELTAEYEMKEAKSPTQKLRDFDKSRTAVGKKPIFKDKGTKFVKMKKKGQKTIMNVPSNEVEKYIKKGYTREEWSFKDIVRQLQEKELTDTELKRREEIAKDLSDDDFKKRYGDRWKEVKIATATKMAKKESLKT